MSAFDGKWTLIGGENVEAFYEAVNTPPEFKKKMKALAAQIRVDPESYIEELRYDNATNVIQRTTYVKGSKKRVTEARLDVEHSGQTIDGRPAKIVVKLESDSKFVRYETAADFESTATFEVSGDELIVTQMTSTGVKSVERYRRH